MTETEYTGEMFEKDIQKILKFLISLHPDFDENCPKYKSGAVPEYILKDVYKMSYFIKQYFDQIIFPDQEQKLQ